MKWNFYNGIQNFLTYIREEKNKNVTRVQIQHLYPSLYILY